MEWIAFPVTVIFIGLFFLIGWIMNKIGMMMIVREVSEATVWERSGMVAEAEGAFDRVASVHDSFWFSPLQRQRNAKWISGRLARFHLAQPVLGPIGQNVVCAYLRICPEDEAVAQGWIEGAIRRENHLPEEHDLAGIIGAALSSNETIQRLLAELYLSQRRSDFEALQTYRRIWQTAEGFPAELIRPLCALLLDESHINDWALEVYLRGHAEGDAACVEGLAAGICRLKPNAGNRSLLAEAGQALSHMSDDRVHDLADRFQPLEPDRSRSTERQPRSGRSPIIAVQMVLDRAVGICGQAGSFGHRQAGRMVAWALTKPAKARWWAAALIAVAVGVVVTVDQWSSSPTLPVVPPSIEPLETQPQTVTDPFTIQVAAYLKRNDAQRFVDGLKSAGVDAFWTEAKSVNRSWYQVKVSHFATKEAARMYGESLKTKGLIDDFYVANYTP